MLTGTQDIRKTFSNIIASVRTTCHSDLEVERLLADDVLDDDGVDAGVCALRGGDKQLGTLVRVADGNMMTHWSSILQPGDIWHRRGLE